MDFIKNYDFSLNVAITIFEYIREIQFYCNRTAHLTTWIKKLGVKAVVSSDFA